MPPVKSLHKKMPKMRKLIKIVSELALSSAWLPKSALSALMVRYSQQCEFHIPFKNGGNDDSNNQSGDNGN